MIASQRSYKVYTKLLMDLRLTLKTIAKMAVAWELLENTLNYFKLGGGGTRY